MNLKGYGCMQCGREHPAEPFICQCPRCHQNLDVLYDYQAIRRTWSRKRLVEAGEYSLWRYLPLLPVKNQPDNHSLRSGYTPLVSPPGLAAMFPAVSLYLKDDTRNPSGSLKDRATEVALQHAAEQGQDTLLAASTGNAAASLALLAAFYRRTAVILAPRGAPEAKRIQILQAGARLCLVEGSYDQAFDLAQELLEVKPWYPRLTGYNPILSEGKKTAALEIAEQLRWQAPDLVFVPVGDGCIIGGIYKGFYDLHKLGWISRIPRLVAVQAAGSKAIIQALETDGTIRAVPASTLADSIAVNLPRDGLKALRAVRESAGFGITVNDDEILQAQQDLASRGGIFAEPAAAATLAGFLKTWKAGRIPGGAVVVLLITGTGLKDLPAARQQVTSPEPVPPHLEAVRRFLEGLAP